MYKKIQSIFRDNRIFTFLVIFRWAALIPALLSLNSDAQQGAFYPVAVLVIAALANTLISVFNRPLNQLVVDYPLALGIDLLFSAGLLSVSGGTQSSYYLYALSPLLAGAFFFQVRGALLGAMVFSLLYLMGSYVGRQAILLEESAALFTQLTGIWLIPILFAYSSRLLKDITRAREELSTARDQLAQKH
ncbi:MAG TPA: hypothetical protein VFY25_08945, partial [Anaerolineales bacterium]|nr:hypothetical protein [Anaerolineales bacterium]